MGRAKAPSLLCLLRIFFFFKFKTDHQKPDCRSNVMWLMILHNEWPWYQSAGSPLWRKSLWVLVYVRPWLLIATRPRPLPSAGAPPRSQGTQKRFAEMDGDPIFVQSLADSLKGHPIRHDFAKSQPKYRLYLSYWPSINAEIFPKVATCQNASIGWTTQNRKPP